MNDATPPTPAFHLNRRQFLATLLLATLLDVPAGSAAPAPTALPDWLAAVSGEQSAVQIFGKAYLRDHPEEGEITWLLGRIEADMIARSRGAMPTCTAERAQLLQQLVRSEFLQGDFVRVEGWSLSRTEARIYAAVTLLLEASR